MKVKGQRKALEKLTKGEGGREWVHCGTCGYILQQTLAEVVAGTNRVVSGRS